MIIQKDRPILFSAPMVRAILDGRKTQTRRIMKPQPIDGGSLEIGVYAPTMVDRYGEEYPGPEGWGASNEYECIKCPYGKPGDRLWVRETAIIAPKLWNEGFGANCTDKEWLPRLVQYLATSPNRDAANDYKLKATPSIFMPRWASRILLEITDVRVQRLQDISETDAKYEGCTDGGCINCGCSSWPIDCHCGSPEPTHIDAYVHLWESINGAGSWNANPWVWAVSFKVVQP